MRLTHVPVMKTGQKELLIFLLVAFGMPLVMTVPLALTFYAGKDTAIFAGAQMFWPAAGFMLVKLMYSKDKNLAPKKFFSAYVLLALVLSLWCAAGVFAPEGLIGGGATTLIQLGWLIVFPILLFEDTGSLRACGLLGANWKHSFLLLGLFLVLDLSLGFLLLLFTADSVGAAHTVSQAGKDFFTMFLTFPFSVSLVFGEEYGWRRYFQPLLQRKFGLIKGVFLFGILWGLWHLPLDLFYFPTSYLQINAPFQILVHQVLCISLGIFMAYVYMKTNNVWLPVIIHYCYNYMGSFFFSGVNFNSWNTVGLFTLLVVIFFWPFLCSKVFRKADWAEVSAEEQSSMADDSK